MTKFPSPPSPKQVAILRLLSENAPLNKYSICRRLLEEKKLDVSEPTIFYAVDDLERAGLIEVVAKKEKVRGGKASKYYDLTKIGLMALMYDTIRQLPADFGEDDPAWTSLLDHISLLAGRYHHLMPELFDSWPALVKTGLAWDLLQPLFDYLSWATETLMLRKQEEVERANVGEHPAYGGHGHLGDELRDPPGVVNALSYIMTGDYYERWHTKHPIARILDPDPRRKDLLELLRHDDGLREATLRGLRELLDSYRQRVAELDKRAQEAEDMIRELEKMSKPP